MKIQFCVLALTLLCAATGTRAHDANRGHDAYEVWSVDQSSSPGKTYGGMLYVYAGMKPCGTPPETQCRRRSTSPVPQRPNVFKRPAPIPVGRT